jgi:hypothetical protein
LGFIHFFFIISDCRPYSKKDVARLDIGGILMEVFLWGEGSFSYHAEGREESHISKDLRNFNPGRMKNRGRD